MKSKSVLRLTGEILLRVIIATFMCLMVYLSITVIFKGWFGAVLSQILLIPLFLCLPYSMLWEEGERDVNRIASGMIKKDPFKGFKAGLLASIPFFALWLVLLLSRLGVLPDFRGIYNIINTPYIVLNIKLLRATTPLQNVALWRFVLPLLFHCLLSVVCGVAYFLGNKRIAVLEALIYQKNKE